MKYILYSEHSDPEEEFGYVHNDLESLLEAVTLHIMDDIQYPDYIPELRISALSQPLQDDPSLQWLMIGAKTEAERRISELRLSEHSKGREYFLELLKTYADETPGGWVLK